MNILIVMRLADMHKVHPDQITSNCVRCNAVVGIYPSGQAALKRDPNMKPVCQVCHPNPAMAPLAPGAEFEPFESKDRQ